MVLAIATKITTTHMLSQPDKIFSGFRFWLPLLHPVAKLLLPWKPHILKIYFLHSQHVSTLKWFIFRENNWYILIARVTKMNYFSFIPLPCAECDDSLPHQPFFHPLSPHLTIYFLIYLSILLFPNSYIIPFWEFYFLPLSVHAQTNVIYLTLLSLL